MKRNIAKKTFLVGVSSKTRKVSCIALLIVFCLLAAVPISTAQDISKAYTFNSPLNDLFHVQLNYPKTMYYDEPVVCTLRIMVEPGLQTDLVQTHTAVVILPGGDIDFAIPGDFKTSGQEKLSTLVWTPTTALKSGDMKLRIDYTIYYPGAKYSSFRTEYIDQVVITKKPPEKTPTPEVTPSPTPSPSPTPTPTPSPTPTPLVTSSPSPIAPTRTPTPPAPGFEAIFAISGLLVVAYLALRRKR